MAERFVQPGSSDDAGAVLRSELFLEVVKDAIDSGGIDDTSFDEQRFEGLGAQRAGLVWVVVSVVVVAGGGRCVGQVGFEDVDQDEVVAAAPQLVGGEFDGVHVLRVLAQLRWA